MAIVLLSIAWAGCAQLTRPKMEYRAGLALYSNPKFSFQIPDGWRPATDVDWMRFTVNEWLIGRLNDQGKAQFAARARDDMSNYAAILVHTTGAWMDAGIGKNSGAKFRSGQKLTDAERTTVWQAVEKALVDGAPPTDKPRYSLKFMDVVDYGPNTVLKMVVTKDDRRGLTLWSLLAFFSEASVVTISHGTTPARADDGLEGLAAVGRTFRFE
jgi:hypothetical protein